jgi:ankyrin repeat protein
VVLDKLDVVKALLNAKAEVNTPDFMGLTPLHHAVHNQNAEMVELLLKNGADCDAPTKKGDTALRIALREGYSQSVINVLRKYKAAD